MKQLRLWALAGVALCAGCVSRAELDQARRDDLRYTTRVIGFAVEATEESLRTRIAVLEAFEGDPRYELLTAALGTLEENRAQLLRAKRSKLELIDAGQRKMAELSGLGAPAPEPAPEPEPAPSEGE